MYKKQNTEEIESLQKILDNRIQYKLKFNNIEESDELKLYLEDLCISYKLIDLIEEEIL